MTPSYPFWSSICIKISECPETFSRQCVPTTTYQNSLVVRRCIMMLLQQTSYTRPKYYDKYSFLNKL